MSGGGEGVARGGASREARRARKAAGGSGGHGGRAGAAGGLAWGLNGLLLCVNIARTSATSSFPDSSASKILKACFSS